MPTVALYARCSTLTNQDPETQLRELRAYAERRGWTNSEEFIDHGISGAKDRRPALDALLAKARRGKIDVIVVWALDRFGRSLRHLVTTIDELTSLRVGFVAVTQGIDTTNASPAATLTMQVLGAVAEFERELIRARVQAGVAKARACGKRLGRPRRVTDEQLAEAMRLRAAGASWRKLARAVNLPVATIRGAVIGRTAIPAA